MCSVAEFHKAVSTCACHLTAISIFYGTVIFMYLQPSSIHSMAKSHLCFILWSSQCWTLWSTASGTRRSRVHSELFSRQQNLDCFYFKIHNAWINSSHIFSVLSHIFKITLNLRFWSASSPPAIVCCLHKDIIFVSKIALHLYLKNHINYIDRLHHFLHIVSLTWWCQCM
jgi:hypothetical protein